MTLHPFERMQQAVRSAEDYIEEFYYQEFDRLVNAGHNTLPVDLPLGSAKPHVPKLDLREYIAHEVEAPAAVHRPLPSYGDAWLNTQLGTCGEAMAINGIRAFHSEARTPVPPFGDGDAEKLYEIVGGYNPHAPLVNGENPTDQGTDNNVLVQNWQQEGILCAADGTRHFIEDSLFVDAKDPNVVRLAIWEFVVNFRAYGLPVTAQAQQARWTVGGDGETGDAALGSWGYHDIAQTSFGPRNIGFPTWGLPWMADWDFDKTYAAQGFVVVTQEQKNLQGISPAGIDWTRLNADLAKLAPAKSN